MKKIAFLLISACLAGVAFAAWTKQNARVARLEAHTTFDAAGTATSVIVHAQLEAIVTNDADPAQSKGRNDWTQVTFDLLAAPVASTTYSAAGKTVNGVQLAALLRQAALDEATRQNIAP